MLVVVVVGDGDGDGVGVGGSHHDFERDAAAHGWQEDDLGRGGICASCSFSDRGLDGGDDFFRDGEIHGRADGVVAGRVADDEGHAGVRGEDFFGWLGIDDEVAAGADVVDNALLLVAPVDADD